MLTSINDCAVCAIAWLARAGAPSVACADAMPVACPCSTARANALSIRPSGLALPSSGFRAPGNGLPSRIRRVSSSSHQARQRLESSFALHSGFMAMATQRRWRSTHDRMDREEPRRGRGLPGCMVRSLRVWRGLARLCCAFCASVVFRIAGGRSKCVLGHSGRLAGVGLRNPLVRGKARPIAKPGLCVGGGLAA